MSKRVAEIAGEMGRNINANRETWGAMVNDLYAAMDETIDLAAEAAYLRGKVSDLATTPAVADAYRARLAEIDSAADDSSDDSPAPAPGCALILALPAAGALAALVGAAVQLFA